MKDIKLEQMCRMYVVAMPVTVRKTGSNSEVVLPSEYLDIKFGITDNKKN